jgi:hypothetical protein
VIPSSAEGVWVSRLRTPDFDIQMGFTPAIAYEIPHVRGIPVDVAIPEGNTVIREWPNIAGRLEPPTSDHIVRWHRSLAAMPPCGVLMPRGEAVDDTLLSEMRRWVTKFARSLEQLPGVTVAASGDSPRALVLTPHGLSHHADLPPGMEPVPTRLAEFPGGVVLTMNENSFGHRAEYADAVQAIIEET